LTIIIIIILFIILWFLIKRSLSGKTNTPLQKNKNDHTSSKVDSSQNYDAKSRYFYERHSAEELGDWSNRLSMFRYVRAIGGHANDGDSLDVRFEYNSIEELTNFFEFIGVPLIHHEQEPPQPERGRSYPSAEFNKFPNLIQGSAWINQPSHSEIEGIPVHIWCTNDEIRISASPRSYDVDNSHVESAKHLEKLLINSQLKVIDPPKPTKNYRWKDI